MKQLHSKQYPASHLLNPRKEYVHSSQTNIAETFERIRAEQNKQQKQVRRVK